MRVVLRFDCICARVICSDVRTPAPPQNHSTLRVSPIAMDNTTHLYFRISKHRPMLKHCNISSRFPLFTLDELVDDHGHACCRVFVECARLDAKVHRLSRFERPNVPLGPLRALASRLYDRVDY